MAIDDDSVHLDSSLGTEIASPKISRVAGNVAFCAECSAIDRVRFIVGLRVEQDRARCAGTGSDNPAGANCNA